MGISVLVLVNMQAASAQRTYRKLTQEEVEDLKKLHGVYEPGQNYNVIIDGHGTGWRPPTEKEWAQIAQEIPVLEKLMPLEDKGAAPASIDHSVSSHFPPIGNQDGEGSCTAWASGYYIKTFQEASEHDWDLSGASWVGGYSGAPTVSYQDRIMSPDFLYHQINGGEDNGSYFSDAFKLMGHIGICTWQEMPYDPGDSTSWPSESAWREAALYRGDSSKSYVFFSGNGLDQARDLLSSGHLLLIGVDGGLMYEMATMDNYVSPSVNHANSIVGYDDNWSYTEDGETRYGAFKIANSWGDTWAEESNNDGCWWMSYTCMQERVSYGYLYEDLDGYEPTLIAVFQATHSARENCAVKVGVGVDETTGQEKDFYTDLLIYPPTVMHSYPANKIALDITEIAAAYQSGTNWFFLKACDETGSGSGSIDWFSIEAYNDYTSGIPSATFMCQDVPSNTIDGGSIYLLCGDYERDLEVVSQYDGATPAVGTNTFNHGTEVTCSVTNSPYTIELGNQGQMSMICTGWTGTGSVPSTGSGTNTSALEITTDSSIVWHWALSDLVVSNQTVSVATNYTVLNSIRALDGYTIESTGAVVFEAGKVIKLQPGFTARTGCTFRATIDP